MGQAQQDESELIKALDDLPAKFDELSGIDRSFSRVASISGDNRSLLRHNYRRDAIATPLLTQLASHSPYSFGEGVVRYVRGRDHPQIILLPGIDHLMENQDVVVVDYTREMGIGTDFSGAIDSIRERFGQITGFRAAFTARNGTFFDEAIEVLALYDRELFDYVANQFGEIDRSLTSYFATAKEEVDIRLGRKERRGDLGFSGCSLVLPDDS